MKIALNSRKLSRIIALLSTSALLIAGQQANPPAQPETSTIRVSTRLVEVDVVVHDGNNPVAGLTKDDFTLFDRGKRQDISFFSVSDTRRREHKLPPGAFTNDPAFYANRPPGITVVLLDGLNTRFDNLDSSKKELFQFLSRLGPDDQVAIYAMTNTLRVLHDFTTDPAALRNVIASYRGGKYISADQPDLPGVGDPKIASEVNAWMEANAAVVTQAIIQRRAELSFNALEAVAQRLARMPGRKTLVWVSSAFPFMLGGARMLNNPSAQIRSFQPLLDHAAQILNDANVAVYVIDPRGLIGQPMKLTGEEQPNTNIETMNQLASATGGEVFFNTNSLVDAFDHVFKDSAIVYTLGFSPDAGGLDGKFHPLKVEVNGKRLNVRYRKGYVATADMLTDQQRISSLAEMVWSPVEATAIHVTVRVQRAEPPNTNTVRMLMLVDSGALSFVKNGDKWTGQLQTLVAQQDRDGKVLSQMRHGYDLSLSDKEHDAYAKSGIPIPAEVPLNETAFAVRAVAMNPALGTVGTVIVPVSEIK